MEDRIQRIEDRLEKLLIAQEQTNNQIQELVRETAGLIRVYKHAETAISIGAAAQKIGLWLLKWPLIGAGAYGCYQWVIEHIKTLP